MQKLIIVNRWSGIQDATVAAWIPALQRGLDRFVADWAPLGAKPTQLLFAGLHDAHLPADAWPITIERHSADPGALGWHTAEGKRIYGKVFAGDCERFGVMIPVDLDHEIKETVGDPTADLVFKMRNGELAALEACDAVESDVLALDLGDGVKGSDYVLPAYFDRNPPVGAKFSAGGHLHRPCAALTDGGYMSVTSGGEWTQVSRERSDGMKGRRFLMYGYRSESRKAKGVPADTGAHVV